MRIAALATLGLATMAPRPDGAGCLAGAEQTVTVHTSVAPYAGDAWIDAECPGWTVSHVGADWTLEPGWWAGSCELRAYRTDGALTTRSAPAEITATTEPLSVVLFLPSNPVGGAGMALAPTCGGVRVVEVVPGGPADLAGIHAGHRVVAVDGVPIVGRDTWQVIDRTVGEIGTPVQVSVADDDGLSEVTVERSWIEADWWRRP